MQTIFLYPWEYFEDPFYCSDIGQEIVQDIVIQRYNARKIIRTECSVKLAVCSVRWRQSAVTVE